MSKKEDIQNHTDESDKLSKDKADIVNTQMRRVLDNYVADINKKIALAKPFGVDDNVALEETYRTKTIATLTQSMIDAGQPELIETYLNSFKPLTEKALIYYQIFGLPTEIQSIAGATAIKSAVLRSEELYNSELIRQMIQPIENALFDSIVGGVDRANVVNAVAEAGSNLKSYQLENLVNNEFTKFQRTVTNVKGKELDLKIVSYNGPYDAKTSPQCRSLLLMNKHGVAGMYYASEITSSIVPNLPANPLIEGGHYNCRHIFNYVSNEYAEEQGFK